MDINIKKWFSFFVVLFLTGNTEAQNVGIGIINPPAKLTVVGNLSVPLIPGTVSNGIFRVGFSNNEGIDFGKMEIAPYAGWVQSGFDGTTADPLSLQPVGGIVGIGTTSPNTTALLDLTSTSKGFLPPRMTAAQRMAIATPAEGLLLFQTDGVKGYYYYINAAWTSLGEVKSYPGLTVCTQQWMERNLDVTTYRNGDQIPYVTDPVAWAALTTGAWCYYYNDPTYNAKYGKLYNWYAVNDPRGLAPAGWHVPSDAEWNTPESCLGGTSVAGGKMKVYTLNNWVSPNTGATNSSGFSGLPGGGRNFDGFFNSESSNAFWWSSSASTPTTGWFRYVSYNNAIFSRDFIDKRVGFSVRCLKD